MTFRQFCDSTWGAWAGLFLLAVLDPELGGVVAVCFGIWCCCYLLKYSWRGFVGMANALGAAWRHQAQARAQRRWEREWERRRPQREAQARALAEAERRREDARTNCELFFAQHAPEIGQRFPKDRFDDFVARHLGDDHPPEVVEQRAEQLRTLLREHLEKVGATQKSSSLADLAQWFLREKEQIDTAAIPDADKQVLIAALEERYAKLQEKLIRGLQP